MALSAAACIGRTTKYVYPDDLYSASYVKRTLAAQEFAERKDGSQLPGAFALLLDDESQIRSTAYRTIVALMPDGEDFGYRAYLDEKVRKGIVARWEAWWIAHEQGPEAARG